MYRLSDLSKVLANAPFTELKWSSSVANVGGQTIYFPSASSFKDKKLYRETPTGGPAFENYRWSFDSNPCSTRVRFLFGKQYGGAYGDTYGVGLGLISGSGSCGQSQNGSPPSCASMSSTRHNFWWPLGWSGHRGADASCAWSAWIK